MAEVKWIKLFIDMFDNRKIKQIRKLPEGNNIVLIWVMLLILAGKCNNNGFIFLTENIPYTVEMLSTELDMPINTVQLALNVLEKFNMINHSGNALTIVNWSEYQSNDKLEAIREYNRLAKRKSRENQKQICQGHVNDSQGTDIDIEEDIDIDIEGDRISTKVDCSSKLQPIIDTWNSLNLNKVIKIQGNRLKMLNTRLKEYGQDKVIQAINNIKSSSFLKGQNSRNWVITFDWFVKPNNFIKVLEGNYTDKTSGTDSNIAKVGSRVYDVDQLEKQLLGR